MKKFLALALIFIILAGALCGCKKPTESPTSSEQTVTSGEDVLSNTGAQNQDQNQDKDNSLPNQSNVTGPQASSNLSSTGSTQSTPVSSQKPLQVPIGGEREQLKINQEFLNTLGSVTYAELKQKYGEPTDVFHDEAKSAVYKFNGTDIWYGFKDLDWGEKLLDPEVWPDVPTDKNGKWIFSKAPRPNENAKCNAIYYCNLSDIFLNLTEPIDVVDIEIFSDFVLDGCSYFPEDNEYRCMYLYNGKYITVESDSEFCISPNAKVKKIKDYNDIQ